MKEINELKKQIEKLKEENEDLQAEVGYLRSYIETLERVDHD